MLHSIIVGSGKHLPPFRATNQDIANFFPQPDGYRWTPEWVEEKLGIQERRNAFDFKAGELRSGFHDIDNATQAALRALQRAGMHPTELDGVIYATSTPEYLMPDPACILHMRIGMRQDAYAIGFTTVGCGGFIYAMDLADSDIRAGKAMKVLVVGSVVVGPYINAAHQIADAAERERQLRLGLSNVFIFGEGAGALILQATDHENVGILHTFRGAWGYGNPVTFVAGGSRHPATHETVRQGLHRFDMNSRLVRQFGPELFARTLKVLEYADMKLRDVDCFIFHQVNRRMLSALAKQLEIDERRMVVHVDLYGNLDTATLPVAYDEAVSDGRIGSGDTILMAAIGAGWQYGSAVIRLP